MLLLVGLLLLLGQLIPELPSLGEGVLVRETLIGLEFGYSGSREEDVGGGGARRLQGAVILVLLLGALLLDYKSCYHRDSLTLLLGLGGRLALRGGLLALLLLDGAGDLLDALGSRGLAPADRCLLLASRPLALASGGFALGGGPARGA